MPGSSEAIVAATLTNNSPEVSEYHTNVKAEALHLLSTNALPPYNPGTQPSFLTSGGLTEIHCCSDCGDLFFCKSSLTFHMQRRSVLIRFNCDSCKKVQVFFNRCTLLSHIRGHVEKNESSDISKAVLAPLPRVLMEGIKTDVMKNLEDDEDSESNCFKDGVIDPMKVLEVSMTEDDVELTESFMNSESEKNDNTAFFNVHSTNEEQSFSQESESKCGAKFRCSECSKEFNSAAERKDHFINGDKVPVMISMCTKCGILCPTECSSKAHKRLHLQVSPYVCPECGNNPDRYWDAFQKHLKYQCLHYSRSVGYKCNKCKELCHSADLLKKHICDSHTEALYKCHICPRAFTAFANFHSHRKKIHNSCTIPHSQLAKCSMCDLVFNSKKSIESHLNTHIKENACQYLFSCPECNIAQESKRSVQKHLYQHHPKIYEQYEVYITMADETMSGPKKNDSSSSLNCSRTECLLCHSSFPGRSGYACHLSKSHANHKYPCGVCQDSLTDRLDMISHGKEHLRKNISLCLLCHNKKIKPPEVLDVHLLYHVERVRFQTFCPICDRPLTSFQGALQHLRLEHLLQRQPKSDSGNAGNKTKLLRERKTEFGNESSVKAEGSFTNNHLTGTAGIDSPLATEPRRANVSYDSRLQTGESCCVKCPYTSSNRQEFKKHILSHKENKTSFQCQECGQCFIVEPPLKMHLKLAHKVLDPDGYINKEGTNHVPEPESIGLPEASTSNALECTVCFEVFSTDAQLRTHMRSHGMAFIQAKKTSS